MEQLGAVVLDADAITRALTAPGGAAIDPIRHSFGDAFISPSGALDRDLMRTRVYAEPAARQRLEAIIHPLVQQDIWRQAGTAEAAGAPCLVFDVPLLVESKSWQQRVDKILVIDCSPETQISRVQARSGLSRVAVEAIMATQASRAQRLAVADHVILNDGISLEILDEQVRQLAPAFGLSLPHPTAPGTSA